ncbi:Imm1 family immunity protein [Kribbella deserti]|uniref:Imm1 family immunity protein n=1 Tax=Kribbella deserti TaxID=1926257 RepID=A0ABV6QDS7_9ACTN
MSNGIKAYYKHGHGDSPVRVTTDREVDELIDAVLGESFEYTIAALYHEGRSLTAHGHPDHELRVGLDADRQVGSLRYSGSVDGDDGFWYAASGAATNDVVVYEYMGNPMHFPLDSELPIEAVRVAVKELLVTGDRPTSVTWVRWPEDLRD